MQNQPNTRRIPVGIVALGATVAIAAGGATAWWVLKSQPSATPDPSPTATVAPQTETPATLTTEAQKVEIYLLKDTGTEFQLESTPVSVEASAEPDALLRAAFERLFSQSGEVRGFSAIPPETKLLGISVKDNGVFVDLSAEFTSGGGSSSMMGRLGQIVYTATSLNPNAPVWISVGGEPLELLGGEGLEIPQPITREIFDREFSL
ncbi:GerMN domain-containing protein [Oxynema sp. CENA135]|uniref:GerMN domain-containing protein n=1 Tax=Oxynema sp. CENA135 TaxID=984206 RepID=UPI00190E1A1B|nr:GerMN domain-containing protein [Oxynema sp. CENA135]MBK4732750.1 GerMN domain-containing protein [Oxynema sp. CENA135]